MLQGNDPGVQKIRSSVWRKKHYVVPSRTLPTISVVRGEGVCPDEKAYLAARKAIIRKAVQNQNILLSDEAIPICAIVGSGGGIRSMLFKTGTIRGFQREGLLDCFAYDAGLSGSSWYSPLYRSDIPIEHHGDAVVKSLVFKKNRPVAKGLHHFLTKKSFLAGYATFLKYKLFADKQHVVSELRFSDFAELAKKAVFPLPLFSAVQAQKASIQTYEFTPFSVTLLDEINEQDNAFIPMHAFGRFFENGISIDDMPSQRVEDNPEPRFVMLLAMAGSAFVRQTKDLLKELSRRYPRLAEWLEKRMHEKALETYPVQGLCVANFTKGMDQSDLGTISLCDPNTNSKQLNFPYPLVVRRNVDLMFFIDGSSFPERQLQKVADYALQHGQPFQPFVPEQLAERMLSVLDADPNAPIILYMPIVRTIHAQLDSLSRSGDIRMNDPIIKKLVSQVKKVSSFEYAMNIKNGVYATTNFKYTDDQANALIAAAELAVLLNKDVIIKAIKLSVERKKKKALEE